MVRLDGFRRRLSRDVRRSWSRKRVAAFDLETTGLDVLSDRAVQAAFLWIEGDSTVDSQSWTSVIDPGVPIPDEAASIHGITTAIARDLGVEPQMAFRNLGAKFAEAAEAGIPVVMYNAPFDWPFLLAEASRYGVQIPDVNIIDPLVCDRELDRFRRGSRRLEDVAAHYRCSLPNAHDAASDAAAAGAVARALAERFPQLRESTLPELQARQAEWHARWAVGYTEWRRKSGMDTSDVDPGWPIPQRASHLR